MSIKPYVPDIEAWVAHFKNRDNFKVKKDFYEVKPIKRPPGAPKPQPPIVQIKMVTPQAQVVEQAKAQLAKEKEVLKQQHIKSRIHLLKERQMPHAKSRHSIKGNYNMSMKPKANHTTNPERYKRTEHDEMPSFITWTLK